MGATVVPSSTGNSERQLDLIKTLNVKAIACTPSYLMHLGEVAAKMGIDIRKDTQLSIGVLGAEPWSDGMRDRIYESLGVKGINIYGTSELSGPLWCECEQQNGMHVWSDLALVEIVDPKTGKKVAPGEKGELVITMLQKEALTDHPLPYRGHHDGARGDVRLRTDASPDRAYQRKVGRHAHHPRHQRVPVADRVRPAVDAAAG